MPGRTAAGPETILSAQPKPLTTCSWRGDVIGNGGGTCRLRARRASGYVRACRWIDGAGWQGTQPVAIYRERRSPLYLPPVVCPRRIVIPASAREASAWLQYFSWRHLSRGRRVACNPNAGCTSMQAGCGLQRPPVRDTGALRTERLGVTTRACAAQQQGKRTGVVCFAADDKFSFFFCFCLGFLCPRGVRYNPLRSVTRITRHIHLPKHVSRSGEIKVCRA